MYVCIYIYIYICIHTHIYTHTLTARAASTGSLHFAQSSLAGGAVLYIYIYIYIHILDSRTGRGIPLIETRKENGAGNDRNPARDRPHQDKQKKLGNGRAGVG